MSSMTDDLDWQLNKNLQECMLYMLEHEVMCDISFKVGPEQKIVKAHKFALCSRSPVFYIMIEGSLPETGEITIPDIDPTTFRVLLEYMYTDKLVVPKEIVGKVLYASEKYMLPKLKDECEDLLRNLATTDDATIVFQTAHSFNMPDLLQESFQHILQCPKQCLYSEEALNLSPECMDIILNADELMMPESAIYTFLLQWATYRCMNGGRGTDDRQLREAMGKLIFSVRFPLIDQDFFTSEISTKEILSKDELLSVYRSFNGIRSEIFSDTKRQEPIANRVIRYGSVSTTGSWISDEQDAITLMVDKPVYIKGIISFGTKVATACLSPGAEIRDNSGVSISSVQKNISVGFCETFDMDFPNPVLLQPNSVYTIVSKGVSRNVYYGDSCKSVILQQGITFSFGDSIQSKTATSSCFGQIAGISFQF